MIGILLLSAYSICMVYFCVDSLAEKNRTLSVFDWVSAILLPFAAIVGAMTHPFVEHLGGWTYYFLALWLAGIVAFCWELQDIKEMPGGFTIGNIFIGVIAMLVIFGPGLFLAGEQLKRAFASLI